MSLDHVGRQLGNYQLTRLLGKGGFAHVYLGRHRYLHSHAALKILQVTLAEKETRRFQQEAQTLVQLIHPHIVRILDFFVTDGAPVLVMDYAPGGTLRQCHPRGTQLPLATIIEYVQQISAALQYAHQHGIIHRDIKPENILLGKDKQLILSDFGLALFAPSPEMLSVQEMAGTLLYMAPEQLRGKPLFASDQYSLAIMVYEWLCGAGPFVGTYWELMQQHMAVMPQSIRKLRTDVPAEVEKVILKALTKNPQERFTTIAAFALALQQAAEGKFLDWKNNSTVPMPTVSVVGGKVVDSNLAEHIYTSASSASSAPAIVASASSPVAQPSMLNPTSANILLTASPVDAPLVARLQTDLQQLGIYCLNGTDPLISLSITHSQQAMSQATTVAVLVSAHTGMTTEIKQQLRMVASQQRRLVYLWIEGEEITTILAESASLSQEKVIIDARADCYDVALKKLATCLKNPSTSIHTFSSAPTQAPDKRMPPGAPDLKAGRISSSAVGNRSQHVEEIEPSGQLIKDIVANLHSNAPRPKRHPILLLHTSWKKGILRALLLLTIILIPLGFIQLHTWQQQNTVTTTSSDGAGSLRQIIANAQSGSIIQIGDQLRGQTLDLGSSSLEISRNISIQGPQDGMVFVSSGQSNANIHIDTGVTVILQNIGIKNIHSISQSILVNEGTLTLEHVAVTNNAITSDQGFIPNRNPLDNYIQNSGTLTVNNSSILHNQATNCFGGSGIYNIGKLTVNASQVLDNGVAQSCLKATDFFGLAGRAITNSNGGNASIRNSKISGNTALGLGGGIANAGSMDIDDSTIANNTVFGPVGGGGIFNKGKLTITSSNISQNTATGTLSMTEQYSDNLSRAPVGSGGGINNSGQLLLQNSTITNNSASATETSHAFNSPEVSFSGGGIYSGNTPESGISQVTLINSTVSLNNAYKNGGGLFIKDSSTSIDFCTLYGNSAHESGGGIYVAAGAGAASSSSSPVQIKNSLVAQDVAQTAPDIAGPINMGGYNLIQNSTGSNILDPHNQQSTDLTNLSEGTLLIDTQMDPVVGKPFSIYHLMASSIAINRIPLQACDVKTDQVGTKRPQGKGCDVGAIEYTQSQY